MQHEFAKKDGVAAKEAHELECENQTPLSSIAEVAAEAACRKGNTGKAEGKTEYGSRAMGTSALVQSCLAFYSEWQYRYKNISL